MSSQLHETSATVAAIILAGGASSRLGGTDKTRLPIAGASALRAGAARGARRPPHRGGTERRGRR